MVRHSSGLALCALVALQGLLLTGCGPKEKARFPVFPVKGQAFLQGQPAVGALVILHPDVGEADPRWESGFPRGVVQADGSFSIGTYDDGDGAPAWQYVVVVSFPESDPNEESENESPEEAPPAAKAVKSKFQQPSTSPLKFKVVEQKLNEIPRIDLP